MIIYMFLSIVIAFSIITGIVTTIIEKKGLHTNTHNSVIQTVDMPKKVMRPNKDRGTVPIPIIQPDPQLSHTMEILNLDQEFEGANSKKNEKPYYSEPVLTSVMDDEII